MLKVIKILCRYFFTKPKKMCLSSKIIEVRNELLQNCKYAIDRLKAAQQLIEKGSSAGHAGTTSSEASTFYKSADSPDITSRQDYNPKFSSNINYEIKDVVFNQFISLTHGVLFQEWEHFLYDIFVEGIIYYLKGYDLGDINHKLYLKNLKPTIEVEDMRKNISAEIKTSRWGYENLFNQSLGLFKAEECELLTEMKKQAQIRHIFQHSRGKIRKKDLEKIGQNGANAHFDIFDDEGNLRPYKENEEIILSKQEIQKLYDTIEKYSLIFQTQAEKCEGIQ